MKKKDHKILTRNKRKLATRLLRKNYSDQPRPMFQPANLHYQMSEWNRAIGFGGIGAVHTLDTRKHRLKEPETVLLGFSSSLP